MPMNGTTHSGHGWGLLTSSSKPQHAHAHNQADGGNSSVEFLLLWCVKLTLETNYDRDYLERGRPTEEEVRVTEVQAKYVMSKGNILCNYYMLMRSNFSWCYGVNSGPHACTKHPLYHEDTPCPKSV